jgi:hypothetical protein
MFKIDLNLTPDLNCEFGGKEIAIGWSGNLDNETNNSCK